MKGDRAAGDTHATPPAYLPDKGFELHPRLPACLPVLLHGFAHYVTAENPVLPPACERIYLWEPMYVAGAALQEAQIPHLQISTKRLKASPDAVSCILSLSCTHAHIHRQIDIHTHTQQHSSHLFKTPNTFAHIFTDVCFHQPNAGRLVQERCIQRDKAEIREISMLLRSASVSSDWLWLTDCGRAAVAPPTASTTRFLPPLPFKTT